MLIGIMADRPSQCDLGRFEEKTSPTGLPGKRRKWLTFIEEVGRIPLTETKR